MAVCHNSGHAFCSLMSSRCLSVPVSRAADDAKTGSGHVYISDHDPHTIIGVGTKFTTEAGPRMQIMLPKSVSSATTEVVEVISDTEVRVKKPFGGDNAQTATTVQEKLDGIRANGGHGLTYRVLPYVNQTETYKDVYKELQEGGCVGIFPEGESYPKFVQC